MSVRLFRPLVLFFAVVGFATPARPQDDLNTLTPTLVDTMDGVATKLLLDGASPKFRAGRRSIDRGSFQFGSGAERIQVRGPAGEAAEVAYPIGQAPVISELRFVADLVSNRAGVRLAVRVVLPRSRNPSTGQPFSLLVRGGNISSGRNWEQLNLDNLPQQLANHARVARAQYRQPLDERGAYVSHLVFLTPGGKGVTELLVDRIQVFGVVNPQTPGNLAASRPPFTAPKSSIESSAKSPSRSSTANKRIVRVPRIIQWQGEPFEALQKLGFNTIGLNRLPSEQELKQVARLGLAIVCPPPPPEALDAEAITADHNSILAWNFGELLSTDDLNHIEHWERLVTRYDPIVARPTVLAPQLNTLESSRISDVLLIGRATLGSDLTVREHAAWLSQRQHLARPGTSTWTKIETQPSRRHRLQMVAMAGGAAQPSPSLYAQQTAAVAATLGIKSRGFYFSSESPLDAAGQATDPRSLALELTNFRIQLLEPWLLAGKQVASARSSQPDLSALVMQAERSHLLVPVWWSQDWQAATHPRSPGPVSFVVPGVAESSEAFLVTLGGVQRVRHKRVTGGIRISLDHLPFDGFLLLSDDRQAIAHVTQYVRRIAPRATELRRSLATARMQQANSLIAGRGASPLEQNETQALLRQAETELAASGQQLAKNSYAQAYLRADAAELNLDQALQNAFDDSSTRKTTGIATANHLSIPSPDRSQIQRTLARAPLSTNLLHAGGFENLEKLLGNGWRHRQLTLEGITSSVRLSPESPHSGSYCLELEARAIDPSAPVTIVPTAPVWIASHPVQVRKGDLLEITGVARLPEPLVGSVDGLQIIDSFGGTEMALRIQDAPTWQPFKLVRAATSDAQVSVTIALTGLGKAQVDDVAVRVVRR